MLTLLFGALMVPLCAVAFRIRGGALEGLNLDIPGQICRLIFALTAGCAALIGAPWWAALATVPAWWVASTLPLFDAIDLGTHEGTFWGDFCNLFWRGFLWGVMPSMVLEFFNEDAPLVLVAAAATMPVCYWLGLISGIKARYLGAKDFCETAEAIYGAVLGVGIILSVTL